MAAADRGVPDMVDAATTATARDYDAIPGIVRTMASEIKSWMERADAKDKWILEALGKVAEQLTTAETSKSAVLEQLGIGITDLGGRMERLEQVTKTIQTNLQDTSAALTHRVDSLEKRTTALERLSGIEQRVAKLEAPFIAPKKRAKPRPRRK